ncbi:MAG: hypothetical protein R2761_23990 [Acidimicrobiales bacterium]
MARGRTMLVAPVALLAVLTSCGGGDDTEAGTGGGDGEAVASPLSEYFGQADYANDPEQAQAQMVEEERARQEAIAACMKREGFEYIPQDPSQYIQFGPTEGEEYGSDEWTAKYGFGISTQRFPQSALGPDLVGYDDSEVGPDIEDPNAKIQEALSPEEQAAYQEALYGDMSKFEIDPTLSEEEQQEAMENMAYEPEGCEGEAMNAANSLPQKVYTEFSDEMEAMYERVRSDPRIVEAEQKIKDCVADKGLDYPGQEEVYTTFEERLTEIDAQVTYPGAELTEDDYAAMSEEELRALGSQPPVIPDEAKAELAEVQAEEIALAKAVNECDGGQEEQIKLYQEVSAEYEQEFVDAHAERLAELKSEAGA